MPVVCFPCRRCKGQLVAAGGVVFGHKRRVDCREGAGGVQAGSRRTDWGRASGRHQCQCCRRGLGVRWAAGVVGPGRRLAGGVGRGPSPHPAACTARTGGRKKERNPTWERVNEVGVLRAPKALALPVGGHRNLQRRAAGGGGTAESNGGCGRRVAAARSGPPALAAVAGDLFLCTQTPAWQTCMLCEQRLRLAIGLLLAGLLACAHCEASKSASAKAAGTSSGCSNRRKRQAPPLRLSMRGLLGASVGQQGMGVDDD